MESILTYCTVYADVVWVPEPRMGDLTLILCTAGLVFVVVVLTIAIIRYNWNKKSNVKDDLDMKTDKVNIEVKADKED